LYTCYKDGQLTGIIIAYIKHAEKEIYVPCVLVSDKSAFSTFKKKWASDYPTYKIVGRRQGKLKTYSLRNFHLERRYERSQQPTVNC